MRTQQPWSSQRFKGYCCKSDTPECRLTENYAYAVPLKYV